MIKLKKNSKINILLNFNYIKKLKYENVYIKQMRIFFIRFKKYQMKFIV